jgi:hypothetical protein
MTWRVSCVYGSETPAGLNRMSLRSLASASLKSHGFSRVSLAAAQGSRNHSQPWRASHSSAANG